MITKEEYEFIKAYGRTFYTAAKQSYARILPHSINERLDRILNDGQKRNFGCSACVLGMYRKLYNVLEEAKKHYEKVENEPEPAPTVTSATPKTKKSATNKSKKKEE